MGRRKKEPRSVHREAIASAAQVLFQKKGIEAASMDEIARAAGYSKATLYVYYKNKEEIVGVLVLESMKMLYDRISQALEEKENTRERYDLICQALVRYQEEYPFYFKAVLSEINIDFSAPDYLPEERETFQIGEKINEKMICFIEEGIEAGDLRRELSVMSTIFSFWGMLSGLILMASNKEPYIEQELRLSRQEFLEQGFDTLYRSVTCEEETR